MDRPREVVLARVETLACLAPLLPEPGGLGTGPPVDELLSFECDFLALGHDELAAGARDVLGLFLDKDVAPLVRHCQWNYHACNPYHNFAHGVGVLCGVAAWLRTAEVGGLFGADEKATLAVAALGHDLGHPGVTEAFLLSAELPVARLYGSLYLDQPRLLERHHAHLLLELLRAPGCDVFAALPAAARERSRKTMVRAILATSLDDHHRQVAGMDALLLRARESGRGSALEDALPLVEDVLLHTADLSQIAAAFPVAHSWNQRILDEFAAQRDLELARGLAPTLQAAPAGFTMTLGFIKHIAQPLFVAAAELFPESFGPRRAALAANMERYEEICRDAATEAA